MESRTEIIDVKDWTMKVKSKRVTANSLWDMAVIDIKSSTGRLPDWSDADNSYETSDSAIAAGKKWAERQFK